MTTYITGNEINTTRIEWMGRACKVTVTLLRCATLGLNGWIPAATHAVEIKGGDRIVSFDRESTDAEGNYCVKGDMGRVTITVPAEHRAAVQSLFAERRAHNRACDAAQDSADHADQVRHAAVESMMTAGGRSH